ncbi:MAG: radical SAM family heme chaperone HemW, partial [Roseburia sp.]|nr:radical SAM family heme chaperone HemW [Roseburia sp.]
MHKKQLELYIHIPFCVRKCQYCDFLSFPADDATQNAYVQALLREIAYYGPKFKEYVVTTMYIGGGTPSWLAEEAIEAVMAAVHEVFTFVPDAEISIECNPGTVTDRKFAAYKRAGINRISIGLQSANDTELALLGRIHTYSEFLKTYELARGNGFDNINVDLMNSLPGQTLESFQRTLQQVLRLSPEHISAYSLIVEEGT